MAKDILRSIGWAFFLVIAFVETMILSIRR
jgi:hypothetical protein